MRKSELYKKQCQRCFYCEKQFSVNKLTRDHFIPVAVVGNGKRGARENIVLACEPCNQKKGAKLPKYYDVIKFVQTFNRLPHHLGSWYKVKQQNEKGHEERHPRQAGIC